MLFSSIPFLFYFLPCVLIFYFAVPRQFKNFVLTVFSLIFYGWGEPKYLIFMVISILQGYLFGILIEVRPRLAKLWVTLSVVFSLGLLGYCKYMNFFVENFNALTGLSVPMLGIALPIGISFYTFQILSYTVDVYRGDAKAQRNVIHLATYISMFPQLIAGPIVRYSDIEKQLRERTHSLDKIALGARRFVIGLAKKVLLANVLGEPVSIFRESGEQSVLFFWIYAISYMLHVYFDFSGYSDMAIGLGHVFGFTFAENFNYPFISASATEFWRRWHISLGSWFRDYLYIPLGGNRVNVGRWIFNLSVVWLATGLWHGAAWNFVLWGVWFAVWLLIEKLLSERMTEKVRPLGHLYLLVNVSVSFVLFDAGTLAEAWHRISALFGGGAYPICTAETLYYLGSFAVVLAVGIIAATPLPRYLWSRIAEGRWGGRICAALEPLCLVLLLVCCTAYLVDGSFNPFLYFRF